MRPAARAPWFANSLRFWPVPVLAVLLLNLASFTVARALPSLTATKTDALVVDADHDGRADPGDTLRYTVEIHNPGTLPADTASGVIFSDTLDPNTTLVSGSFKTTPVGVDDIYESTGNNGAFGNISKTIAIADLLVNDYGIPDPEFLSGPADNKSSNGGDVVVDSGTGQITYDPPPGFTGTDTFTYTIRNDQGTNTATVHIAVSNMVWFINGAAALNGDGRLSHPFKTVGSMAASTLDKAGDLIYIYSGNYTSSSLTLLANQRVYGQSVSLQGILGDAPTGSAPYPAVSASPVTLSSTGTILTLASGNTLQGLVLNPSSSGSAIAGSGDLGTTTVSQVTINSSSAANGVSLASHTGSFSMSEGSITDTGTGLAFTLNSGSGTLTLNNVGIESSGGGSGISLASHTGSFNMTGAFIHQAGSGAAFKFDFGSANLTLTNVDIDTSISANGVELLRHAGSFTMTGGSIDHTGSGTAVKLDDGAGSLTCSAPVTLTGAASGQPVSIQNKDGGTVQFSGAIVSPKKGILLNANTDSTTISFSGGLTLDTTINKAFEATSGGTLTITGVNTISTTTAAALYVSNTLIGSSGLTFQSINSTGGDSDGIYLDTPGSSGGLTITGTAAANSGGSIVSKTGADGSATSGIGIYLKSTRDITLNKMTLSGFSNFAIRGENVTNFTLNNTTISGVNGSSEFFDEDAVRFDNLFGTAAITDSAISGGFEDNLRIANSSATPLDRLTITNTTFGAPGSAAYGDDSLYFESGGSAVMKLTVTGSTFNSARGDLLQANALGNSTMDVVLTGSTFNNGFTPVVTGGGGVVLSGSGMGSSADLTYSVTNNTLRGASGSGLLVFMAPGLAGSSFTGSIAGNTIGVSGAANSGSLTASGIEINTQGVGTHTTLIDNNTIYQYNESGILLTAGDGSGAVNATLTRNTIASPGALAQYGIRVTQGLVVSDAGSLCAAIGGSAAQVNQISGTGAAYVSPIRLRQKFQTGFRLPGYGGSATDLPAVQAFVSGNNTGVAVTAGYDSDADAIDGFSGGAACANPPAPTPDTLGISPSMSGQSQLASGTPVVQAGPASSPAPATNWFADVHASAGSAHIPARARGLASLAPVADSAPKDTASASPTAADIATGAFTLPPGKTITITFEAVIKKPLADDVIDVCNQGTVSATDITAFGTDDPDVSGTANRTCTTVYAIPETDLVITKTDNLTAAVPGEGITYTITASNPVVAGNIRGVKILDTLPTALENVTWDCQAAGGAACPTGAFNPLTSTIDLPSGGSATLSVHASIKPDATGTLFNKATLDLPDLVIDPDETNNEATDNDTVLTPEVDLSVVLTRVSGDAIPGQPVSYTILVGNAGPSTASGALVTDDLPDVLSNVTWTCAPTSGAVCAASGAGDLSDTVTLPPAGSLTYSVNGTLAAGASGNLENSASVGVPLGATETDSTDNQDSDTVTISQRADLSVTITDNQTTEVPGTQVVYTITAANAGPSSAPGATLTVSHLPALTSPSWTCTASGGAACPADSGSGGLNQSIDLPSGGSLTYTLTADIPSAATGTLSTTAAIASPSQVPDQDTDDQAATDADSLTPQADLSLDLIDGLTSDVPGTELIYTLTARNAGPSDAPGVGIDTTLPASLTGVSWACTAAGGAACAASGSGNVHDTTNLPAGSSVVYTFQGQIAPDATDPLTAGASLTVPSGVSDTSSGNDNPSDTTTLTPQADLAITKDDSQTQVAAGGTLTYTIRVTNAGPSSISGVHVEDTPPASLTGVSWTCAAQEDTSASCAASGSDAIAETEVILPVNTSVTYTLTGTLPADASGTLANTATVSHLADPDTGNNSATDTDPIVQLSADLSILKTADPLESRGGQPVTFTIRVSNAGPHAVSGARVVDTLPANLENATWTCAAEPGAACAAANGSGSLDTTVNLPVGGLATFTIQATIKTGETGQVSNTAEVFPPALVSDPDPADNTSTAAISLAPQADLSVTKTDGQTGAVPGEQVTYTIVLSNAGPSPAIGATITDTLPAALEGASWTCAAGGGAVCPENSGSGNIAQTADLPKDGSLTYTLTAAVKPDASGTLTNTAVVASPVEDLNPANNSAADSDTLTPRANLSITKSDGVSSIKTGQTLTYTILVSNPGPSSVRAATVTDSLPAALTGASWTCAHAAGSTCTPSGTGGIQDAVDLPVGGTVTYTLTAAVGAGAGGTLANTASIAPPAGVTDPDPSNDAASDTTLIAPNLDLSITLTDGLLLAHTGDTLTYTIVVSNPGPAAVTGARVSDELPAELENVSWTCLASSGAVCPAASGSDTLNETVNLPAASSLTYTVTARVKQDALHTLGMFGILTNTASLTPPLDVDDANLSNNTAVDSTTIDFFRYLLTLIFNNGTP